jgi:hypothetical protein
VAARAGWMAAHEEEMDRMMKIVIEKATAEQLARYLQNKLLRVYGVTPISEGYKPNEPEQMQTLYNIEILVVGDLRKQFLKLLEAGSAA